MKKKKRQKEEDPDIGFALHCRYSYYADELSPNEYRFWECYYDNKNQIYIWESLPEYKRLYPLITGREFLNRKAGEITSNLIFGKGEEEGEEREGGNTKEEKRYENNLQERRTLLWGRERELSELIYLAGIPIVEDPRISTQLRRRQQMFY